jgi:hypothetical protein
VSDENAPEFHDRFSIHPDSGAGTPFGRSRVTRKVDALSDWEAVQHVEKAFRGVRELTEGLQGTTRAMKGAAARFAQLNEALAPVAAENAARELEAFLAIDHSD